MREHAAEYGVDPSLVVVAGGSAGAHLASMAALTPNEPSFQPGFERLDTSVSAAICLCGYYGNRDRGGSLPSSPHAYIRQDAPPFFIAHGDNDGLVPAAWAASFADALRKVSLRPVVYAQLPGAQHTFDLLHSVRFERVIDGIEAFTAWVRAQRDQSRARRVTGSPQGGAAPTEHPRVLFSPARAIWATVLGVAVTLLVSGCGGSPSTPSTTLAHYLAAWSHGDWAAMRSHVLDAPADFTTVNSQAFRALGVSHASLAAGRATVARSKDSASARVSERFTLPKVGVWTAATTVHMLKRDGTWYVRWSPATVNPSLKAGDKLAVRKVWPARAPIVGTGGAALTRPTTRVVVGVVGRRIKNARAVRADLLTAGATRAQVNGALAQASAHPTAFEPVFTVSSARFGQLKSQPAAHNVYAVRGTEFARTSARAAITAQLASHVVGSLGPITAQQLQTLGAPYDASSTVGQTGLEASQERALAVVANPLNTYDTALQGAYPPGSTFKVLTFTALDAHGLAPSSPTSCPSTVTVDGEPFHNAGGVGPAWTIADAFTESCNTAFINLATAHLSPADYPTAAQLYGLTRTPRARSAGVLGQRPWAQEPDRARRGCDRTGTAHVLAARHGPGGRGNRQRCRARTAARERRARRHAGAIAAARRPARRPPSDDGPGHHARHRGRHGIYRPALTPRPGPPSTGPERNRS